MPDAHWTSRVIAGRCSRRCASSARSCTASASPVCVATCARSSSDATCAQEARASGGAARRASGRSPARHRIARVEFRPAAQGQVLASFGKRQRAKTRVPRSQPGKRGLRMRHHEFVDRRPSRGQGGSGSSDAKAKPPRGQGRPRRPNAQRQPGPAERHRIVGGRSETIALPARHGNDTASRGLPTPASKYRSAERTRRLSAGAARGPATAPCRVAQPCVGYSARSCRRERPAVRIGRSGTGGRGSATGSRASPQPVDARRRGGHRRSCTRSGRGRRRGDCRSRAGRDRDAAAFEHFLQKRWLSAEKRELSA